LRRSDDFLKMMKEHIDRIIAISDKLQKFLAWAEQETNSMDLDYKSAALRALYIFAKTAYSNSETEDSKFSFYLDYAISLSHKLDKELTINRNVNRVVRFINNDIITIDALDRIVRYFTNNYDDYSYEDYDEFNVDKLFSETSLELTLALDFADDVLRQALQSLKSQLPTDRNEFYQWWKNHAEKWIRDLRQVCIDRRSIGHDWQLTREQAELLNQYYAANLLLVECMNRSYVSKQVREEIESTMLLPRKK